MKKTLGGDRLGAGKKMQVELHGYERSSHDLSYIWRSTAAAGTLIPFMSKIALPGDTFDIDLNCEVLTHPTLGPLFGSYKVQLDVFQAPMRLYNGMLHNNKLGIGMKMDTVKFPILRMTAPVADLTKVTDYDNMQVNPSCILSYLGIRGVGIPHASAPNKERTFNGTPLLAYWDIYKNYYANKQEEIGYVVHTPAETLVQAISVFETTTGGTPDTIPLWTGTMGTVFIWNNSTTLQINTIATQPLNQVRILTNYNQWILASDLFTITSQTPTVITGTYNFAQYGELQVLAYDYIPVGATTNTEIGLQQFELSEIDDMREAILGAATSLAPFDIFNTGFHPYDYVNQSSGDAYSRLNSQEGLGIKTYQSDMLNNWLSTEWIDGANGIAEITAIDTTGGSFTIDTLVLSRKVYDMLNRIAVSGGTYDDWLDAVYTHDRYTRCESPIYHGGLSKELVFQEVISNSEAQAGAAGGTQPLGTLAGRGVLSSKHKGGQVTIKVDEPSYIMGIVSLTPRLDYSQGNQWDVYLESMDDLHKPALDEIGFQELLTHKLAWWSDYQLMTQEWVTPSAGKQPAWLDYMTDINVVRGNFAVPNNEMFMTLVRRYKAEIDSSKLIIGDLTTYIDPRNYNQIFAQTSLDSQNFWVQIGVNMTARRKMSAKVMPNL